MARPEHERIYATPNLPPFEFHELDERLLAGRNPLTAVDVDRLVDAGVTHVLDLREESEWTAPGRFGREAVEAYGGLGIERLHVPVRDVQAPSPADLDACSAWISRALKTPGTRVYVHCRAGRERTAAVLLADLVSREGLTLEQADAWLRASCGGRPLAHQVRAVQQWLGSGNAPREDEHRSRVLGCVLAGAVGDALGAAVEFDRLDTIRARFGPGGLSGYAPAYGRLGAITDDTQMTLFTMEGLIRASVRGRERGICHPASVVRYAYMRWLSTQQRGVVVEGVGEDVLSSGWLVHERGLHARRAPGNTCLSGLRSGRFGSMAEPLNDSKGCGGVMRVAPAGLIRGWSPEAAFEKACEFAALTHGHPTGWLASGALAYIVRRLLDGDALDAASRGAVDVLREHSEHEETTAAILAALELAERGDPTPESVESLGAGWIAEEALSIALYAALSARDLRHGLLVAVNHSGDSDSTGAIAGNLLGVMQGVEAVPGELLGGLELRRLITTVAEDFVREVSGEVREDAAEWWGRYPGW